MPLDDTSLARTFYGGDYDEVLAVTADRPEYAAHPLVIGALALGGRLDEAQIATSLLTRDSRGNDCEPAELVEARFFLTAGFCHAGRLDAAMSEARRNLPCLWSQSPRSRFFAAQGLGLIRYFQGRMHKAALLARRALRAAMEAGLPYARLLALDLRGHILVQSGNLFAGLRLLRQAEQLACGLGFGPNAETIAAGILDYELGRRLPGALERIHELESAARNSRVAFFSRRNALCELIWVRALGGQHDLAEAALREVVQIALPDADRRGRLRFLLAQAAIRRFSQGSSAAASVLSEARRIADCDPALRVELAFARRCLLLEPSVDEVEELEGLAHDTCMQRAEVALKLVRGESNDGIPLEDRLSELLLMLADMEPRERIYLLINESLLGLLPAALGLEPGRRIVLIEGNLITENNGHVAVSAPPTGPSLRLLEVLSERPHSRAELIATVWGIGKYAPHRHDPTLQTAIARLRSALAPRSDWVVTTDTGYGLASGVEVLFMDASDREESVVLRVGSRAAPQEIDRRTRALRTVAELGEARCSDIASELDLSSASALRLLTSLVSQNALERIGKGKATRYRIHSEGSNGATAN